MFSTLAALAGSSYVVPAVIAVVTAMFLLRIARRRGAAPAQIESMPTETKSEREAPAEVRQWQVECHDLARSTRAELDSRVAALQQLLVAADQRIARLESFCGRSASEPSTTLRPHFDPPPAEGLETATARTAAIYAMSDAGLNAAAIANRLRERLGEIEATLRLRSTLQSR
jgi:hypothetical protein